MDSLFGPSPLPSPDVAPSGRRLRSGSVDGRFRLKMGNSLQRSALPGEVDCGCPSPYQCQGASHAPHLPSGLSAFLRPSSSSSLEVGQHDRNFLRQEGRRYDLSDSPPDRLGYPATGGAVADSDSPRLRPHGRESGGGCGISVPVSPGLASPPVGVRQDMPTLGVAGSRSVCDRALDSADAFLRLGSSPLGGSLRCPPSTLGFQVGVRFPSSAHSSPRPGQDSDVEGGVRANHPVLESPKVVSSPPQHEDPGSSTSPASSRLGDRSDDKRSSAQAGPRTTSRLEDFRRLHASSLSAESFRLVAGNWRKSSSSRYDAAWRTFKDFLSTRKIPLDQVDLTVVTDYLSHLFVKGLAYRTICLHRSVLSMTLPHIDRVAVGEHPLVCRVVKGIFNQRPPTRKIYDAWDVGKVFKVFTSWPCPLSLKQLQRKAAFLVAMATSRRPSELASLRCSSSFMSSTSDELRFLPSCLSKTDRQTHLGPPIVIKRLSGPDSSLCAVAALENLLQLRSSLQLDHDYVFFQFKPPYEKVSTASFSQRLAWALKAAGISAPPGSTRSVSVSDAFSRGVDLAAILRAGDWSGAQTFYRHYLRPSMASSQK